MKKSAVILVSMLFSIAVPTLAESAADYTQSDTFVSHKNGASISRDHQSLPNDQAAKANKETRREDLQTARSQKESAKDAKN